MLPDFRFHHIGIAVNDIDVTAKYYIDAGYIKSETVVDPIQNIEICFLTKDSMPTIELLAAVNAESPVVKILEKVGVSPYHNCYEVDDIEIAIKSLKRQRYIPLSKPVVACALENKRVCFLYNKDVGLIELVERE